MSWLSPFAPSDSTAWPDSPCKRHWIGPFDLSRDLAAKYESQNAFPEAPELQRLRRLADVQHTASDHIGSRNSLAQIVEQYISDHPNLMHTMSRDYRQHGKGTSSLEHRINITIGGIINSYFTQYPELNNVLQDQKDEDIALARPFRDAVEKQRDFEDPGGLYTIRVILYYAASQSFRFGDEWIWKMYREALNCTERIFGSEHPDVICLLQGSARAIERWEVTHCDTEQPQSPGWKEVSGHRVQRRPRWKGEVDALLSRALSGLRKLHGSTAAPTLDCAYEAAMFRRRCGNADAAEAMLQEMCAVTEQELGEEHSETLRFKAALSELLLEQGRSEEAGLNVHKYISEQWEAISRLNVDEYIIENVDAFLYGTHTDDPGWRGMILLNRQLSCHQSPSPFAWAHHNLYTLPVRNVELSPVFPTEEQKDRAWRFSFQASAEGIDSPTSTRDAEAQALVFMSSVRSDLSVDLRVPYIPYFHFMSTVSFEDGEPYLEYVKAEANDLKWIIDEGAKPNTPIKIKKFIGVLDPDSAEKKEHDTDVGGCLSLDLGSCGYVSKVQGFFNYVPTDSSLVLGGTVGPQLNLVSSKWADWKQFTLHPPPNNKPLLGLADGTEIKCHGYISGTWTNIGLQLQRKIFQLYVVDAVFSAAEVLDDATYLFALSANTLEFPQYHELSGLEKRTFCGKLNPSLYRLDSEIRGPLYSLFLRKMKNGQVDNIPMDANLWEEMNRREQWDRDFEGRKRSYLEDKDELERALSVEEYSRSAWDERHRDLQSASETGTGDSDAEAAQALGILDTTNKKNSWSSFRAKLRTLF